MREGSLGSLRYNGKKYRYFYAITADVDDPVSAGKVYKVTLEQLESPE